MSTYRVVHQEIEGRRPCLQEVTIDLSENEEKRGSLPVLGDKVLMFGQVPRIGGTEGADELVCHGKCETCRETI